MTIKNKTEYKTDVLLKICERCLKEVQKSYSLFYVTELRIKYHWDKRGRATDQIGGYTPAIMGKWVCLLLPPLYNHWCLESWTGEYFNKAQIVAMVFIHELGHLLKVKHNNNATIEMDYKEFILSEFTTKKYNL
jgi:predicted Zn-dependent protease with MMP-like domain